MNSQEEDFQKRLDQIGQAYEDGKDAINSLMYRITGTNPGPAFEEALDCIRELRDIAAISVKAGHKIQEN
ncbi:MAG: hypothetical protein WKF87_22590 [Chryseolinea sp.]